MKSFSQFWEEVSLSDLKRKHSQSAEGRMQARLSARKRSESEALKRKQDAKKFTQRKRAEMLARKKQIEAQSSQQQQDAQEIRAKREAKEAKAKENAAQTGRNIRRAIRGTTQLSKVAIRGIRKAIKNRKK